MTFIRRFIAISLATAVLLPFATTVSVAEAASRAEIDQSFENYQRFLEPVLEASEELHTTSRNLAEQQSALFRAEASFQAADATLRSDRTRFAGVAVSAYMERGSSSANPIQDPQSGVALLSARLRTATRARDRAEEQLVSAQKQVERSRTKEAKSKAAVDAAEQRLSAHADALDSLVRESIPTLSGTAYASYRLASEALNEQDSDCRLPTSLFAGIGRIMSKHGLSGGGTVTASGRSLQPLRGLVGIGQTDTDSGVLDGNADQDLRLGPLQLQPADWFAFGVEEESRGLTPDTLLGSSLAVGKRLCARADDLSTDTGLHRALTSFAGNPSLARAIMGAARQATRSVELRMGELPIDARQQIALERLTLASPDESIDGVSAEALLSWSRTRLGTPYSQCLGPDVRPEDPECPFGTNRFGDGFFDCSGFVSAAYAALGIEIPTTTDAMFLSDSFAAFSVGDHYDEASDRAGDILLMDGHVALSAGGGVIIHASGGQLTEETMPSWVRNGILGVYRLLEV